MGQQVTLNLDEGDTFALLVNGLHSYALVLKAQSDEQRRLGNAGYAESLAGDLAGGFGLGRGHRGASSRMLTGVVVLSIGSALRPC